MALQILAPAAARHAVAEQAAAKSFSSTPSTSEAPRVELGIEGSLRHLEAAISFHYSQPGIQNPNAEAVSLAKLIACGFENDNGKAVLRGEDAVVKFFAADLPRLK